MDTLSTDDLFYLVNELKHDDLIRFCQTNRQHEQLCNDEQYWKQRVGIKYDKTELPWDLTWRQFDHLLEKEQIKFIPMVFVENFESTGFEKYYLTNQMNYDAESIGMKVQEKLEIALIKDDVDYFKNSLYHYMKHFVQTYMYGQDSHLLHYIYFKTPYSGHEYEISVGRHNNVEIGIIIGMIIKILTGSRDFFKDLNYIAMYNVELDDESDDSSDE